ncbi:recombinase family protein [Streptomyces sp. NPDC086549]|uniref:recombinase family protein n=1 Tax=Streptomyces sp. NPDC086549 TaxID=3365752 RepID=UPI003800EE26
MCEMKRLGRDAAELTALADHLFAHGLALEMLAGPLAGMYDPSGHGKLLFAFFAAVAETERENIRESPLEAGDESATARRCVRQGARGGARRAVRRRVRSPPSGPARRGPLRRSRLRRALRRRFARGRSGSSCWSLVPRRSPTSCRGESGQWRTSMPGAHRYGPELVT